MWYKIKTYVRDGIAVDANSKDDAIRKFLNMIIDGEVSEDDFVADLSDEQEDT